MSKKRVVAKAQKIHRRNRRKHWDKLMAFIVFDDVENLTAKQLRLKAVERAREARMLDKTVKVVPMLIRRRKR